MYNILKSGKNIQGKPRMAELKRLPIKYIRDKIKSQYPKSSECFICGSLEEIEFHHYNTLTLLLDKWLKVTKHSVDTVEQIEFVRDLFIDEFKELLISSEETVTLCKFHHTGNGAGEGKGLHKIYGKAPALITAPKQKRWVQKQRDKYYGLDQ